MNILSTEKRVAVISALVEGNSIRSTVRMTGVAKDTVLKLLGLVGEACISYQGAVLRNLPCKRIERDEIWCYCYAKDSPFHQIDQWIQQEGAESRLLNRIGLQAPQLCAQAPHDQNDPGPLHRDC